MSGFSQTVSRDKLWSYDAGQHTCTVTDGVGSTGRATMEMNIIGIYIYIMISQGVINCKMDRAVYIYLPGKITSVYEVRRFGITVMDMWLCGKHICMD